MKNVEKMKPKKPARVLVSIINWNNNEATNRCLASFARLTACPDILLIDNNSLIEEMKVDNSFTSTLPLTILRNETNLGFAAAHNESIEYATIRGYDYICLLNNDTELIDFSMFDKLIAKLDESEAIAIAPTILSTIKPDIVWYGGGSLNVRRAKNHHNFVGQNYDQIKNMSLQETSFITGCCVVIKTERDITLDESYFLYWEDADWCAKMTARGEKLLYLPSTSLVHHTSSSLGARSPKYAYYNIRNQVLFAKKWSRGTDYYSSLVGAYWIATKYILLSIRNPKSTPELIRHIHRAFSDARNNISGELKGVR